MNSRKWTAAMILVSALLVPSVRAVAEEAPASPPSIEGRWVMEGEKMVITITPLSRGVYGVISDQWEGVGLFDGKYYWGVFRYGEKASPPELARASGTHKAILRPDGSLSIHGEYSDAYSEPYDVTWTREPQATRPGRPGGVPRAERRAWPREAPPAPPAAELPKLGEYVFVEELPEAITKVRPVHDPAARDEGTVLIQALVGADGLVKDTRVVKSIPDLDPAAVAAVRQWVFKPARAKGKPVAVWVAVPVVFSRR